MRNSAIESRFGMIAVPALTSSSASLPFTMNAFENSRCPLMEMVPGLRPPEGESTQISVAPAIQGHSSHRRAADDFAHLCIGRFCVNGVLAHRDRLRLLANFQYGVNNGRGVRVDGDARSLVGLEACLFNYDVVTPDGKVGKRVESPVVCADLVLDSCREVGCIYSCVRNYGVARILYGAGHTPINSSPRIDGE